MTSRAAGLYAGWQDEAPRLRQMPSETPLRVLDARSETAMVYVQTLDPIATGWVALDAILPTSTDYGPPPGSTFGTRGAFLDAVTQAARASSAETGVPVSVTVGQAILESDWGQSLLARRVNNYFGMKGVGTDGVIWMPTLEFADPPAAAEGESTSDDAAASTKPQPIQVLEPFRAYRDLADSVADHDRLFHRLPRYAPALEVLNDPRAFAHRIAEAGYSTDPAYADKLIVLMERHDLFALDS